MEDLSREDLRVEESARLTNTWHLPTMTPFCVKLFDLFLKDCVSVLRALQSMQTYSKAMFLLLFCSNTFFPAICS